MVEVWRLVDHHWMKKYGFRDEKRKKRDEMSVSRIYAEEREDEEDFKNWKVLNGKSPIMRRVPDYYNRRVNGSEKATFR